MKNRSFSIDVAMATRKFYCHKCGDQLIRESRTRIIQRGDPDYREHSHRGHTHMIGDVELTEYDFKCRSCDRIIPRDAQYVTEKIQKRLGKHILSEQEIFENEEAARSAIERKKKIVKIVLGITTAIIVALVLYFEIKSGEFSFKFYL